MTTVAEPDVSQAVLQSIRSGLYPESEAVAASQLSSSALPTLQHELRKGRDEVENQVRHLSKDSAPDIDGWIAQAKQVQADIERSKQAAREIVQQAEANAALKERMVDATAKVGLLEQEVAFNESLTAILDDVRSTSTVLNEAKDDVVGARIGTALGRLQTADAAVGRLEKVTSTKAYELLQRRLGAVKASLQEETVTLSDQLIQLNGAGLTIAVTRDMAEKPEVSIESIHQVLSGLDALPSWLGNLKRKLNQCIFDSLLSRPKQGFYRASTEHDRLSMEIKDTVPDVTQSLADIKTVVAFLSERLPTELYIPLSQTLMPGFLERLESEHLHPSVPLSTGQMGEFEQILEAVGSLAGHLETLQWDGSSTLREWVDSAPRVWLSRQREHALGEVRKLLFVGLHERKTVERVETQTVAHGDIKMAESSEDADDAWTQEWTEETDDTAADQAAVSVGKAAPAEDDDASAWDAEFDDDQPPPNEGDDEGDAWGWGDEEQPPKKITKLNGVQANVRAEMNGAQGEKTTSREVTLKETYVVTAVPDGVLDIILHVFNDAKDLSDTSFAQTPIASSVSALYNLPTSILAMYRATAAMSYSKVDCGNLLTYNDSVRLSDQLRSICNGKHTQSASLNLQASTIRKLENDIKALDIFAKRAYGTEMEAQRTVLRDMLDGAQGFSNCTTSPFAGECDSAIAMTIDRIGEVYRQWQSVLSQSALLQSIGSLLSTALSKIIMDVEDLSDIGEEESKTLKSYFSSMSTLNSLFVQQHTASNETRDMTGLYCPNWLKFQYLAEILEGSLADIKYLWTDGELSLEFAVDEVVDLIEALFADSDYRRRAIADIRRSGR